MAGPAASKPTACHYCGALPGTSYFITVTERSDGFIWHRWCCAECYFWRV